MFNFAKKSEVLVSTMLPKWGFKSASANGMKAVAALKSYGLVEDSGKKAARKIILTDRSYRILHGVFGTDPYEVEIKDAALSPPMYQYMWKTYGTLDEMSEDESIASKLVLEKKFNSTAVSRFLTDYRDTIKFAKLGKNERSGGEESDDKTPPNVEIGDVVQWTSLGVEQFPIPEKVRAIDNSGDWVFVESSTTGIPIKEIEVIEKNHRSNPLRDNNSPNPPSLPIDLTHLRDKSTQQDTFSLNEGDVIIRFPSKMSLDSFDDFTDWLVIQHRKIARNVDDDKGTSKPKIERIDKT